MVFKGLSFGEKIKMWEKIVDTSFKSDILSEQIHRYSYRYNYALSYSKKKLTSF